MEVGEWGNFYVRINYCFITLITMAVIDDRYQKYNIGNVRIEKQLKF